MEKRFTASTRSRLTIFIVTALCLVPVIQVEAEGLSKTLKLFNYSIEYNKLLPPAMPEGGPVNVSIRIEMADIGPVDKKTFTMESDFILLLSWRDPRLQIPSKMVFNREPAELIWVPDLFFLNARSITKHKLLMPSTRTRIDEMGNVKVSVRVTAVYSCLMNLRLYPFDTQRCVIEMESYSFPETALLLSWDRDIAYSTTAGELSLPGYEVTETATKKTETEYMQSFSRLTLYFCLARLPSYFLYQIYLPTMLMVTVSWGTFWLPTQAVPARVALIITTFLATVFIMQGVSSEITKVSYNIAVQVFTCGSFLFIAATMIQYVLVLREEKAHAKKRLEKKSRSRTISTSTAKPLEEDGKALSPVMLTSDRASSQRARCAVLRRSIDQYARIIFPATYGIFIFIYAGYYSTKAANDRTDCMQW